MFAFLAVEKKTFEKNGLEVDIEYFPSTSDSSNAFGAAALYVTEFWEDYLLKSSREHWDKFKNIATFPSIKLMRAANLRNAAGFVINVGSINKAYIDTANELDMPLFELPWSIRSVDLSQSVCMALIEEKNAESTLEQILNQIIYGNFEVQESIIYNAMIYNIDLRQPCQIAVFDIDKFGEYLKRNEIESESAINNLKQSLLKIIKDTFEINGNCRVMSMLQGDEAVVLFPAAGIGRKKLIEIAEKIQTRTRKISPELKFSIGVGNVYDRVNLLNNSFLEADRTVKLVSVFNRKSKVLFFKDIGVYSLLFSIEDEKRLEDFYIKILGEIMEYDRLNSADLVRTLDVYLTNNCNSLKTANDLFIHRNTLRYRLDKIREILNIKIRDLEECSKLIIAFHTKKYLEVMKK